MSECFQNLPDEENLVKEIINKIDELKSYLYKGLAGSGRAKKRARAESVELEKKMKEYRVETLGKNRMENILPVHNSDLLLQAHAWVAFIKSKEYPSKIIDFRVYDTSQGREIVREVIDSLLPEHYLGDIGNCLMDWDEWTICDVLFKFGFQHTMDKDIKCRALEELSRIKEWQPQINIYLGQI